MKGILTLMILSFPHSKIIFILFIILFPAEFSFAQDFKGGITMGISASQVNGDALSGYDKAGLVFGGFVFKKFTGKWSSQMQIVLVQKGSRKMANPEKGDNDYYKMKLDYIDVPLTVLYNGSNKYSKFFFESGLYVGTLIYSHEWDEYGDLTNRPPYRRFDFGWKAGISYVATDHIHFYVRTVNSILPIRGKRAYVSSYEQIRGGQYNVVLLTGVDYYF